MKIRRRSRTLFFLYSLIFFILFPVAAASVLSWITINRTFSSLAESYIPAVERLSSISVDFASARTELYRYLDEYEKSPYLVIQNLRQAGEKLREVEKYRLPDSLHRFTVEIAIDTRVTENQVSLLEYHAKTGNRLEAAELSSTLMVRSTALKERAELLKINIIDHIMLTNIESRKKLLRSNLAITSSLFAILALIITAVFLQNRRLFREVNLRTMDLSHRITELEETKRRLTESEARFETLFHKAPLGYQSLDEKGCFLDVNDTWLHIMGYERNEVIGKWFGGFIHENDLETFRNSFMLFLETGEIHAQEVRLVKKNRQVIHVSYDGRIDRNSDGSFKQTYSIFHDVTKRRELEEQLRHSEKMNAIGQLAGGIAHDFNNQLAGIMGYTELIRDSLSDDRLVKYADLVLSSSQHAAELIRQLLFFARKGNPVSAPVDVHRIIEEVEAIIGRSIDRKITLKETFAAEEFVVSGDSSHLQNALLNIVINARDAMPDGGTITISTGVEVINEIPPAAYGENIRAGKFIRISVADTGCGIPGEIQDKVFEPFFTTKGSGKGTGLGLSAVYGAVREHKGFVTFSSRQGEGTVFDLYLPLSGDRAKNMAETASGITGRRKFNIMIVDDEEILRSFLGEILKKEGHAVYSFSGGKEAADFYRENWKKIDFAIIDMIMPGMNGTELFACLKEINPDVRVVISSGYSLDEELKKLDESGILGFLQKPYKTSELIALLNKIFE